jgi:hypothetical protein
MVRKILRGLLITFLITLLLIVLVAIGFYLRYFSSDNNEKLVEIRDNKGRVVERRITDYDCCEGYFEKTVRLDTLGKILSEVGSLDDSKFRVEYFYSKTGNLVREKRYDWLTDSKVNDSLISADKIFNFSTEGNIESVKIISYYLDDWDTLSCEHLAIAKSGDTISWTIHSSERIEYEWGDSTLIAYKLCKIYTDKIKGTTDTISTQRVIPRRYHRNDF